MASIQDDRGYNQGFQNTPALRLRTERRASFIAGQMPHTGAARALEIGCGTGEMAALVARKTKYHVLGIDLCEKFICEAKTLYSIPNLAFQVADFSVNNETLLTTLGTFDCVFGNGILHHLVRDMSGILRRIKGLLKPKGRLVFLEPNLLNPYCALIFGIKPLRRWARLEPDEMAFTRRYIRSEIEQVGFSNVDCKYRDFLLPNTPEKLIHSAIRIGDVAEKIPLLSWLSQSLFISAERS